ncbi:MAG: MmgE/PrpD family protein [Planctomycetes bacterium]|nr:MmgE/PrpD family protein [Planctomycetota bacterium]
MPAVATDTQVKLPADSNQALGIARFAIDFLSDDPATPGEPSPAVLERTNLFFTDAVLCGLSALALKTNAPTVLREEALQYPVTEATKLLGKAKRPGATVFGSKVQVQPEKAIVANCSAVREWDSNGTNFGYNPGFGHTAGEFGHNDFYSVAVAAAQMTGRDGAYALRAMVLHDEIRGRLAEVFSLKTYKVDHVVHGAIASAAVFGAMLGATAEQIESAIGMTVAHAIPFRAIRAGKQLSDSKGASAAISTEFAVLSVKRSMAGFLGPRDIFRNPEAIFRIFEGPGQMFQKVGGGGATTANTRKADAAPFDLILSRAGEDFTIMGMHFKLGLYEHQSAGALQAVMDLLDKAPGLLDDASGAKIANIKITAYEPAFGIIGDPAKRNPTTRQSADHSMVYIVATLLRKALESKKSGWTELMLEPDDYHADAINNPLTRKLMDKIEFAHGGDEYDRNYPDGIPTSLVITDDAGKTHDSGMVMYPGGHARNTTADLKGILRHKFNLLGQLVQADPADLIARFEKLGAKSADQIRDLHDFTYNTRDGYE